MQFIQKDLLPALRHQLAESETVQWVVYLSDSGGWHLLRGNVLAFLRRDGTRFHLTVHRGKCLSPQRAEHLAAVFRDLEPFGPRAAVRAINPPEGLRHAKVYAGLVGGRLMSVIVGSANLSEGGLTRNEEASISLGSGNPQLVRFLEDALAGPPLDLATIERLRCPLPPDGPPSPFVHLVVGHNRDSFGMSRVYLDPAAVGLPDEGTGTVRGGKLELRRRSHLSFDLLDLAPDKVAKDLRKLRSNSNPDRTSWVLHDLGLKVSLGYVVPAANRAEVHQAMEDLRHQLRAVTREMERPDSVEQEKQLRAWSRELCSKLKLKGANRRAAVDALTAALLGRAEESWKHLSRLSVDFLVHPVPDLPTDLRQAEFQNELVIALMRRIEQVAKHRNVKNAKRMEARARLVVLGDAVRSKKGRELLDKLGNAADSRRRAEVAAMAHRYGLMRHGWFGETPSRRIDNVRRDWLRPDPEEDAET
jgi:hypothetical protein